jgi:hypothetical protein
MSVIEAEIKYLKLLYLMGKKNEKGRDMFVEHVNEIFGNVGTAKNVGGLTQYQKDVLKEMLYKDDIDTFVLLYSRQTGKTTIVGIFALLYVLLNYPKKVQVLLIGPILRYSSNLFNSVGNALDLFAKYVNAISDTRTGYRYELLERKSRTEYEFAWGARILCLPAKRVRGFSPSVIIIDEASFMPEESWQEILPMLKVEREERVIFILSSTPFGTMTRFYNFWLVANGGNQGYPFHITYRDCPFIDKEAIEKELRDGLITENEFKREYMAEFIAGEGQAIPEDLIVKAFEDYETFSDGDFGV